MKAVVETVLGPVEMSGESKALLEIAVNLWAAGDYYGSQEQYVLKKVANGYAKAIGNVIDSEKKEGDRNAMKNKNSKIEVAVK